MSREGARVRCKNTLANWNASTQRACEIKLKRAGKDSPLSDQCSFQKICSEKFNKNSSRRCCASHILVWVSNENRKRRRCAHRQLNLASTFLISQTLKSHFPHSPFALTDWVRVSPLAFIFWAWGLSLQKYIYAQWRKRSWDQIWLFNYLLELWVCVWMRPLTEFTSFNVIELLCYCKIQIYNYLIQISWCMLQISTRSQDTITKCVCFTFNEINQRYSSQTLLKYN